MPDFLSAHIPIVMGCGRNNSIPDWHFLSHSHDSGNEIILILDGINEVTINGRVYHVERGDVMLFPRGVEHEERSVGKRPLKHMFMMWGFPNGEGEEPLSRLKLHIHDEHGRIDFLMRWIEELLSIDSQRFSVQLSNLMTAVLYEFIQLQKPVEDQLETAIRRHIRRHMADPLTLDDLASVVSMSKYHFSRTFKQVVGTTPMEYLRQMRVAAAKTLLKSTPLPMKAIAPQVGLGDEYHFSRVFRKVAGMSPKQYR